MKIDKTNEADKIILSPEGRLDTTTSPELQNAMSAALTETDHLILDFAKLVYVSSAGLRVLLMAHKAAVAKGGSLVLKNVSAEITEVLEITGFADFLVIADQQINRHTGN